MRPRPLSAMIISPSLESVGVRLAAGSLGKRERSTRGTHARSDGCPACRRSTWARLKSLVVRRRGDRRDARRHEKIGSNELRHRSRLKIANLQIDGAPALILVET